MTQAIQWLDGMVRLPDTSMKITQTQKGGASEYWLENGIVKLGPFATKAEAEILRRYDR